MIYTPKEYSEIFPRNGKQLCERTIRRMIIKNQLPTFHNAMKKGNRYLIEVNYF